MLWLLSRVSSSLSSTPNPGANRKSVAPRNPPISTVARRASRRFAACRSVVPFFMRTNTAQPERGGGRDTYIYFSNSPAVKSTDYDMQMNFSNGDSRVKLTTETQRGRQIVAPAPRRQSGGRPARRLGIRVGRESRTLVFHLRAHDHAELCGEMAVYPANGSNLPPCQAGRQYGKRVMCLYQPAGGGMLNVLVFAT